MFVILYLIISAMFLGISITVLKHNIDNDKYFYEDSWGSFKKDGLDYQIRWYVVICLVLLVLAWPFFIPCYLFYLFGAKLAKKFL